MRAAPGGEGGRDGGAGGAQGEAGGRPSAAHEACERRALPAARPPCRPRKLYAFTEATENLHQGLPACGAHRQRGGAAEARPEAPGGYEPSFGQAARARDAAFRERKSSLMEELFGAGCVLKAAQGPRGGQTSAGNAFGDSRATGGGSAKPPSPSPSEGGRMA